MNTERMVKAADSSAAFFFMHNRRMMLRKQHPGNRRLGGAFLASSCRENGEITFCLNGGI
ncbi:hypothetical protein C1N76_03955 [Geobacillus thermoleovorans]|uniref:Uncharacterized protein n=3 Tax=Geobacillus thermoleovorans group TaxID=1505648 RepID=A0A2Z3N4D4_GEOTH|nr:hypothetical protein C1N76_03955 [Geobacillus thermoleovorans]GAD14692.1 hypothetical protein GBL_2909 [Geobacillus kaustophilus GBlys]